MCLGHRAFLISSPRRQSGRQVLAVVMQRPADLIEDVGGLTIPPSTTECLK